MRKHLIQFLLVAVLSVFSAAAFAQTTVRGQLVDSETGEPLSGCRRHGGRYYTRIGDRH